ncbi:uncharacterized protein LOC143230978 isoform X2 [Tachypleus tridentatus]|uniref:uncharacterized protein LOC143230978 isoform X2 n=1 Tax=Tachypleus tridentatus TaxID=6853 RepID=UPI003FD1A248
MPKTKGKRKSITGRSYNQKQRNLNRQYRAERESYERRLERLQRVREQQQKRLMLETEEERRARLKRQMIRDRKRRSKASAKCKKNVSDAVMEVLEIKVEPFYDEQQNALLNLELTENEEKTITPSCATVEALSSCDRGSHAVCGSVVAEGGQENNCGEVTGKTEASGECEMNVSDAVMEVLEIKMEPFYDEEQQNALLNLELTENEEKTITPSSATVEALSLCDRGSHAVCGSVVAEGGQENNCGEVTGKTEASGECEMNVSDAVMEVLEIKMEPFYDEEQQNALLNLELTENEEKTITPSSATVEALSLCDRGSHAVCGSVVAKGGQENNCSEVTGKTENTLVKVKTEPPDLQEDEAVLGYSENNNDYIGISKDEVLGMGKEN